MLVMFFSKIFFLLLHQFSVSYQQFTSDMIAGNFTIFIVSTDFAWRENNINILENMKL